MICAMTWRHVLRGRWLYIHIVPFQFFFLYTWATYRVYSAVFSFWIGETMRRRTRLQIPLPRGNTFHLPQELDLLRSKNSDIIWVQRYANHILMGNSRQPERSPWLRHVGWHGWFGWKRKWNESFLFILSVAQRGSESWCYYILKLPACFHWHQ